MTFPGTGATIGDGRAAPKTSPGGLRPDTRIRAERDFPRPAASAALTRGDVYPRGEFLLIHSFRRILPALGVLLLTPLFTDTLEAQAGPSEVVILRHLSARDQARATAERTARDEEADALVLAARDSEDRGKAAGAALRYERAAALRAPEDARRLRDLTSAADAYRNARHWSRAAGTSLRVAEGNLERGDLFEAARWFTNASYYYESAGQEVRAQQAVWRACLLSQSPLLDGEQRRKIQGPITNCSEQLERLSAVSGK